MVESRAERTYNFDISNKDDNYACAHSTPRGLGIRYVQAVLMALASFVAYSLRSNLSVTIVAMVRTNIDAEGNNATSNYPTYDWDEETQALVLSSFFWGYLITQIPAGILTERIGGHRFLCGAISASSILTVLLPQCAYSGGWLFVCVNRMFQGISQGFVFPSIYTLLGVWAPPDERGRLAGIALGAQLLGTVAATPLSGVISAIYGWPCVFYWFGAMGAAVGLIMIVFGADTPASHRMISEDEKFYIHKALGGAKVKLRIPWKHMLTSGPVWSSVLASSGSALVFLTFLTKLPTYMATVLKFNLEENGILSALPYLVSWIFSYVFSWSCDVVISRGWLQLTTARKVFNSIAYFGSAICIFLMAYSNSPAMSVFLLTAFMGVLAASFPGVQSNFVDLAPNFSGTVFSIANFAAACLGLTGPIIVGIIVTEAGSPEQWRIVFFLSAAIISLSNIIFLVSGTADTQWWNWPDNNGDENDFIENKNKNETRLETVR